MRGTRVYKINLKWSRVISFLIPLLWLNLLAGHTHAKPPEVQDNRLFLNAQQLTEIQPLRLRFIKGEEFLTNTSHELIHQWADRMSKYDVPIYINSVASLPTGIRDMTDDKARHGAVRIAYNRGVMARQFLIHCGIDPERLTLHAIPAAPSTLNDSITITARKD